MRYFNKRLTVVFQGGTTAKSTVFYVLRMKGRYQMNALSLSPKEQRVYTYISACQKPVKIAEVATAVFTDVSPVKANSWVRNSLRRLRDGLGIVKKTDKGTYVLSQLIELPAPAPATPAPNPVSMDMGNVYADEVTTVKNLDCAMYNDCLTLARDKDWDGFGCAECSAFVMAAFDQRVSDALALIALDTASENEEEFGCAGRKRGVKPGADAKVKPRKLYVIQGGEVAPASPAKRVA